MVDEAQAMSTELLEEIRLLANIETTEEKLLPLILAGQPELSTRLEDPGLRQLKQRVALRCEITPFQLPETAAYIATRIRMAGGTPAKLFTREAVSLIHEHAHGIPRTISVICDNALVSGMAMDRQPVDRNIVLEVCRDFHLRGDAGARPNPFADASSASSEAGSGLDAAVEPSRSQETDISSGRKDAGWRLSLFGTGR
jgi:general secretion pathway protein A